MGTAPNRSDFAQNPDPDGIWWTGSLSSFALAFFEDHLSQIPSERMVVLPRLDKFHRTEMLELRSLEEVFMFKLYRQKSIVSTSP